MNFEKPLEILNQPVVASKQRIILEYLRDEVAIKYDYKFKADQNRIRQLIIGSFRLMDIKLEKNGAYEFIAKVSFIKITV